MSAFLSEEEMPENSIFGYLVADLQLRTGHLGFHAGSKFCDMSPEAQKEIIKDWVMLLNDCIEVLEKQKEGLIQ